MSDVPFHPDLLLKNLKQQPMKQNIQEINHKINVDFKENSPFQEGNTFETFQRLDNHFFKTQKSWETL